jgi:hypothetical protein
MWRVSQIPLLRDIKNAVERRLYNDAAWMLYSDLYPQLEIYAPNSGGSRRELVRLTFLGAEQTFPLLQTLIDETRPERLPVMDVEAFCATDDERRAAADLKRVFDAHGSDKATVHNYHLVYGAILTRMAAPDSLIEIGLGTNNTDTVSNMGLEGRPGASLRAFRDHLPRARIFGADIDRRILFQEERISTFFVDQTDLHSFSEIERVGPFDLIIDDGLHAPNANLAVLIFALRGALRTSGCLVIEDISPKALPIWAVVRALLPQTCRGTIIRARHTFVFLVEKTSH